jgi:hypothetical protein
MYIDILTRKENINKVVDLLETRRQPVFDNNNFTIEVVNAAVGVDFQVVSIEGFEPTHDDALITALTSNNIHFCLYVEDVQDDLGYVAGFLGNSVIKVQFKDRLREDTNHTNLIIPYHEISGSEKSAKKYICKLRRDIEELKKIESALEESWEIPSLEQVD